MVHEADWRLEVAGQRVQITKKDAKHTGVLESGASTAVSIMVRVLETNFREQLKSQGWAAQLKEMIPSYNESLIENAELCRRVRADTATVLKLHNV